MSDKLTCPGCNTHTSRRLAEYEDGKPCSSCGLSSQATEEVLAARKRWGDSELRQQLERALIARGQAEGQRDKISRRLERLRMRLEDALNNGDDDDG